MALTGKKTGNSYGPSSDEGSFSTCVRVVMVFPVNAAATVYAKFYTRPHPA